MRRTLLPSANFRRRVVALSRCWFATGVLLLALVPAVRSPHALLGWLPFWLLIAPLLVLAQLRAPQRFRAGVHAVTRSLRAFARRHLAHAQARRISPPGGASGRVRLTTNAGWQVGRSRWAATVRTFAVRR